MFVSAVVPAAGKGKRLGLGVPKPLVEIAGVPMLIRSLRTLGADQRIKEIILVVDKKELRKFSGIVLKYRLRKIKGIVAGGVRRQDSVRNGLKHLDEHSSLVLIHDAARPFIKKEIISRVVSTAAKYGAAAAGVEVKPTIKRVDNKNRVVQTIERNRLFEIQTPQAFKKELILEAHKKFSRVDVTDDAALVEKLGHKVKVVPGSYFNIKITTPEDLIFAKAVSRVIE
ncbi:MAG: 2-C-methyl-D-erythritol 4-phosphate cytidylyltransferase [Candidatus Omnitrophica bacterium]|nr:2-C-methyl-D-erythritol 4-phosphate cytidylyltransferase [Candidatus Omnitrophota bacterium]MDD5237097.1 2-C-methyl-D-erythritol 4-phosphate cytidylyltransferase [Candidatus Omnitrophota bacterium]MDD5610125.1 2-C-methyl-D-erythritol 4-phosphate cytidylyltransferase [Candidatus Omnitrophota bacterium]